MTNTEDNRMFGDYGSVTVSSLVIVLCAALLAGFIGHRMFGLVGIACIILMALSWLYAWCRTGWVGTMMYFAAGLISLCGTFWWPHKSALNWFTFLFFGFGVPVASIIILLRQLGVEFTARVKASKV